MNFNAATFLDVSNLSNGAVARLGHADDIDHQPRVDVADLTRQTRTRQVQDLRAASKLFALRGQTRNADTCLDLANKLERFGSFVSDKQAAYASQLIGWAAPTAAQGLQKAPGSTNAAPVVPAPAPAPVVRLEKLYALMQRLSKLTIGPLVLKRERDGDRVWVRHESADRAVGQIEGGVLTQWARPGIGMADVQAALLDIERDPEAAAVLHGTLTSRCAICSRELTDPASIARGIGPICAETAGW